MTNARAGMDRLKKLFLTTLDEYMGTRDSKLQACLFEEFVNCQPKLAAFLAKPLLKYVGDAVQPYRKVRVCVSNVVTAVGLVLKKPVFISNPLVLESYLLNRN